MNSTNILLAKLIASLSVLLSLIGGHAGTTATTFGSGVGGVYSGIASIAPSPVINAPVCPIALSNLDNSVGLNTCPGLTSIYVVSSTYPTVSLVLGPVGVTTSTTSTALSILAGSSSTPAISFGEPCEVLFSSVPASSFSLSANITALSTSTATATVTFANQSSSAVTINTTSTAGSAYPSSTVKVACFNSIN